MNYTVNFSFARKSILNIFCCFILLIFFNPAYTQVWSYDFGTSTGQFDNPGSSMDFLPQPLYGVTRVSIGNGGGSFSLLNAGTELGSLTELEATASSSNSINKVSLFDCTPGLTAYMKYNVRFKNANSGEWYFYIGSGSSFSNDEVLEASQAFAGIKWSFNNDGSIDAFLQGDGGSSPFDAGTFQPNLNYSVEFFLNNGDEILHYNHSGSREVLPKNMDVWVNGVLVFDDVIKFDLANNTSIDSWMFYGESSESNAATLILDDIEFARDFEAIVTLPTRFYNFNASAKGQEINLYWENLTESNIQKYFIERSANGTTFSSAGQKTAYLNNGGKAIYNFTDAAPNAGNNFYRIKALEVSGNALYSAVVRIGNGKKQAVSVYPNPVFEKRLSIQLQNFPKDQYKVYLINAAAQEQLVETIDHKGGSLAKWIELPATLKSGVYQLRVKSASEVFSTRVVLY